MDEVLGYDFDKSNVNLVGTGVPDCPPVTCIFDKSNVNPVGAIINRPQEIIAIDGGEFKI